MAKTRKGRARAGLSRELVVAAAVEYADRLGIDALSMRKLAGDLGVEAMSLYNHVKNKEALTKAMLDVVTGKFSLPEEPLTWREFLFERGESMYQGLVEHPWSSMTLMSTFYDGPLFLQFMDRSFGFLEDAGFSLDRADWILNAADSFTYGFVLQKINFPIADENMGAVAEASLDLVPPDSLPHLNRLTAMVARGEYDGLFDYHFGLSALVRGFDEPGRSAGTTGR